MWALSGLQGSLVRQHLSFPEKFLLSPRTGGKISHVSVDGALWNGTKLSCTEKPETQKMVRHSVYWVDLRDLPEFREASGGSTGGLVLGDAGIFGAGVLLGAFPVAGVGPLTAGHGEQRCVVELLL